MSATWIQAHVHSLTKDGWIFVFPDAPPQEPSGSATASACPSRSALRLTGLLQPRARLRRLPFCPQRLPSVVLPCKICTRALNARYEHGQPLQPTAPSRPLNPSAAASSHLPACVDALEGCTGTLLGLHVDECIYRWCCGECICRYCTRAAQPCCTVADTPSVQVGHLPIGHFGDTQHAGCWLVVGGLRAFFAVARSKSDPPRSFGLTPPLQDLSFEVAVEVMNKNKHVRI